MMGGGTSSRRLLGEESLEGGGGEGARRASADLPVLESAHSYGQSSGNKEFNGLRLAHVVGLSPSLKPSDDRSDVLSGAGE
jgi:hypothetical protein